MASIKDDECDETLLEQQLKAFNEMKAERSSLRHRVIDTWKLLKLRSALGHVGLIVSLACYTLIGGLVSIIYVHHFISEFGGLMGAIS